MGHRANYAIREQSQVELFYSNWGANSVPRDVFWGPDYAEAFIRQNTPVEPDDWLDDVFGEGGVAFDIDEKTLVLFGGDKVGYPPLQDVFVRLMDGLWSRWGWEVRWADWGMSDVAAQVGADPEMVTSGPMPSMIPRAEQIGETFRERGLVKAIVTIVEGGEPADRVADYAAADLVAMGPPLVEAIGRMPPLDEARDRCEPPSFADDREWSLGGSFSSCLLIDRDRRRIEYTGYLRYGEKLFNEARWEEGGWKTVYQGNHLHDLATHFESTGRSIPADLRHERADAMSEDECLDEIAAVLFADGGEDPAARARQLVEEARSEGKEVNVDPRALETPPDGRPSPEVCRQRFGWGLAAMVSRDTQRS